MPHITKIGFDSNFLAAFDRAPLEVQRKVLACVEAGSIAVYTSELVVEELMGLAGTGGEQHLPRLAQHVLTLTAGRFMAWPQSILEAELQGAPQFELEPSGRDRLMEYLGLCVAGKIPHDAKEIGQKARAEKQAAQVELRKHTPILNERPSGKTNKEWRTQRQKRKALLETVTFAEVRSTWARKHAKGLLTMNYQQWGVSDPEGTADGVLAALDRHPRHATWIATHALPAYWFRALGQAPDQGDLFDHRQLVYGYDLEVFVTDDKRLRQWFEAIYENRLRVMPAAEFLAQEWC